MINKTNKSNNHVSRAYNLLLFFFTNSFLTYSNHCCKSDIDKKKPFQQIQETFYNRNNQILKVNKK